MESALEQIKTALQEQEWLEADFRQLERSEQEVMDILRQGWQGHAASGFHTYIEEVQQAETRAWKKGFAQRQEKLDQDRTQTNQSLFQLDNQQRALQKELIAYEPN